MLATILLSTICFGRQYTTHQGFYDPARLERKIASQDVRRAKHEELLAQVQTSEATLSRKSQELEELQLNFRRYNELQKEMAEILGRITLTNHEQLVEAKQEVIAAAHEAGVTPPSEATATTPTPVIEMGEPSVSTSTVPAEMGTPSQSIENNQNSAVVEEKMAAPTEATILEESHSGKPTLIENVLPTTTVDNTNPAIL